MPGEALSGEALHVHVNAFVRHLADEKRHSPRTCDSYQRDLISLIRWLDQSSIDHWRSLTHHHLRRYVAHLSSRKLSGRSIARHLSAIRRFYRYLLREGVAKDNPALDIRAPRSPKRLPRVADVDQIGALLDPEPDDPLEIRDLAMFELMYSSGLRLSELAGLDLHALDRRGGEVRVWGKGGKERLLPVGRAALKAVDVWLQVRPTLAGEGQPALFVSRRGDRLSHRSIQQ
ncbi:MAG: site-specific integrase, partial [Pseudomonadota bacterium]|nr:site-specific integrase [Pseudomonadota bacterium]